MAFLPAQRSLGRRDPLQYCLDPVCRTDLYLSIYYKCVHNKQEIRQRNQTVVLLESILCSASFLLKTSIEIIHMIWCSEAKYQTLETQS